MHTIHRAFAWVLFAFCGAIAGVAHAAGTFDAVTGNVEMTGPSGSMVAATQGATIQPGTTITTADGAQAVIKFDDGSAVVLDMNTRFKVVDYQYDAAKPVAGRSVFDFLKGAARFVTGLIARTEHANFSLRTPVATMGVRGTDFDVASGSLYISVKNGAVTATNSAGTVGFGAGQDGYIANAGTLARALPAVQLPDGVGGAFARLDAVQLPAGTLPPQAAGEGGAGGAPEPTGEGGGMSDTTAAAIGLGVVGAAALGGMHSSPTATHH